MAIKIFRFISFTLGLIVLGAVFGVIGALIGGGVLGDDIGALGLAILSLLAGYFLGIVVGIILIRKLFRQRGSLLFGILGNIIGAVIPGLITLFWEQGPSIFFYLPVVSAPVLCLAGFYLRR